MERRFCHGESRTAILASGAMPVVRLGPPRRTLGTTAMIAPLGGKPRESFLETGAGSRRLHGAEIDGPRLSCPGPDPSPFGSNHADSRRVVYDRDRSVLEHPTRRWFGGSR